MLPERDALMRPMFNVDRLFTEGLGEGSAMTLEALVRSRAFHFVDVPRDPEFILASITHSDALWTMLLAACEWRAWLREDGKPAAPPAPWRTSSHRRGNGARPWSDQISSLYPAPGRSYAAT